MEKSSCLALAGSLAAPTPSMIKYSRLQHPSLAGIKSSPPSQTEPLNAESRNSQDPSCPFYSAIAPLRFSRMCSRPWKPQKTRKPWKRGLLAPSSSQFSFGLSATPSSGWLAAGVEWRTA